MFPWHIVIAFCVIGLVGLIIYYWESGENNGL